MSTAHLEDETVLPSDRVMEAALKHRLHIGLVLVADARLTPVEALSLTWDRVGFAVHLPDREVAIDERLARLLYWHACRQRVDARNGGFAWDRHGFVVADKKGRPFTPQRADLLTARFAVVAGLPPMPMSALRHPVVV